MRDPVDRTQTERDAKSVRVGRLKHRADFLRVADGRRWHGKALTLQMAVRVSSAADEQSRGEPFASRVGFTLTKRVGCAVIRNRARRRLKEAVRLSGDLTFRTDADYVIVGRLDAIRLPFEALCDEFARAVSAVENRGDTRRESNRTSKRNGVKRAPAIRADLVNTRPEP